jgi:hypothetical protein
MTDSRPLRILFFLHHTGYLRHYGEPVRLLADRGHHVTVAVGRWEKDPGDLRLIENLRETAPTVELALAPTRRRGDGWRPIAWMTRALNDLSRYAHPRYTDAAGLRGRLHAKLVQHVQNGWADPITRLLMLRIVRRLEVTHDAQAAARWSALFDRVEAAIPTAPRIDAFVGARHPDLVLVSPLVEFASHQVEYLKSARRLGIRTGVCVASWDNLTNKGLMRFVPDGVIVWNEVQRREAVELHGVPADRIALTGAQRFDWWFDWTPSASADEFAARVGLDPAVPYLLYVCSSPFIAPDEVGFVRHWVRSLREAEDEGVRRLGALVRPHPQNAAQWLGVDLSSLGNVAIWPRGGAQPDEVASRSEYFDSLFHCRAVVGLNTSALIEAAIMEKSVFTICPPEFALTQDGTLHFHYLLYEEGGFVHRTHSLDKHLEWITRLTRGEIDDAVRIREFVSSFVRPRGLDHPAAVCVADEIERLGREAMPAEAPHGASTLALHAALTVVAAVAALTTLAGSVVRRTRHAFGTEDPRNTVPEEEPAL